MCKGSVINTFISLQSVSSHINMKVMVHLLLMGGLICCYIIVFLPNKILMIDIFIFTNSFTTYMAFPLKPLLLYQLFYEYTFFFMKQYHLKCHRFKSFMLYLYLFCLSQIQRKGNLRHVFIDVAIRKSIYIFP